MFKKIVAIAIGASIGLAMVPSCGVAQVKNSALQVKGASNYNNIVLYLTQKSRLSRGVCKFIFTNISKDPLVIKHIAYDEKTFRLSYENKPIAPGKTEVISISSFSSASVPQPMLILIQFTNSAANVHFVVVGNNK